MVEIIKSDNANDLFIKISKLMLNKIVIRKTRNLETVEICDAWLILENPHNNLVTLKSRNLNLKYLQDEMLWYSTGSLNVKDINKASSFWTLLADTNGTINSNYGYLINKQKWSGKSQLEWCEYILKKDIYSRQAVLNYNQPIHKYRNNKDFVCTLTQQFIFRDNKLDCIVHMRSNDLIYGLSYDLPWFCNLHINLCKKLKVKLGIYNHLATSLHVYKRHYDLIKNMANENG